MNNIKIPIRFIIICSIYFFNVGCTQNNNETSENNYSISNFKLNQLDQKGNKLFVLTGNDAVIDPNNGNIKALEVIVDIHGDNRLFNRIVSSYCIIDKLNEEITLKGNVIIDGFKDVNSRLKADYINWNISKDKVYMHDNIDLTHISTNLSASKAVYDLIKDELTFTGKTIYTLYKTPKNDNAIIRLESNFAKLDSKSRNIEFKSTKSQVESVIKIEPE